MAVCLKPANIMNCNGNRKIEAAPFARTFRLNPGPAAMHFDDLLHHRQTNAGSFAVWTELIEQAKDSLLVAFIYAATIVFDKEYELRIVLSCANFNLGRVQYPFTHKFNLERVLAFCF